MTRKIVERKKRFYLEERAKRGKRSKFDRALAKVSEVEPEQMDRI